MKNALSALILMMVAYGSANAAESKAVQWSYQHVLATTVLEPELAPIFYDISHTPSLRSTEMLDFLAEILVAHSAEAGYPVENVDALIRILKTNEDGRYRTVYQHVAAVSPLLSAQRSATYFVGKYARTTAEQYVPGSIDLRKVTQSYIDDALAAQPTTELAKRLATLSEDSTIQKMFDLAGNPQQIISGETRVTDGFLIHVKVKRLAFYYRGIGRVVFGYKETTKGSGWFFQSMVADPMAFESKMPYRAKAEDLNLVSDEVLDRIMLVSNNPASVKLSVEKYYYRPNVPLEFMDTAAELLLKNFKSATDPGAIDAYAWICRLLAHNGGPRYAKVLATVRTTTDLKLKKYAGSTIEAVKGVTVQVYEEGSLSLDRQRNEYPSLYPNSTYISGRI